MRIVIGADHAGYMLKLEIADHLSERGHELIDVGTHSTDSVDYPDYAEAVGLAVIEGRAERGVLICRSKIGASAATNKLPGIRAATCHDTYSAHQGVEHDDMNVLVLGARVVGEAFARELVDAFIRAKFDTTQPRFRRRLEKLAALEARYAVERAKQGRDQTKKEG